MGESCDLLKIHYLCGNKDNEVVTSYRLWTVVICSKFITFAVTKTTFIVTILIGYSCDLLKIHYLCGNKDNITVNDILRILVVICSKFITFAVTKTTLCLLNLVNASCDLLKIHYLCGNKDNSFGFSCMKEML